jgi:hypothetical protein
MPEHACPTTITTESPLAPSVSVTSNTTAYPPSRSPNAPTVIGSILSLRKLHRIRAMPLRLYTNFPSARYQSTYTGLAPIPSYSDPDHPAAKYSTSTSSSPTRQAQRCSVPTARRARAGVSAKSRVSRHRANPALGVPGRISAAGPRIVVYESRQRRVLERLLNGGNCRPGVGETVRVCVV